jgi:hypothetical protein
MVHFDPEVMRIYIQQISQHLTPSGCALLHHPCSGAHPVPEYPERTIGNRKDVTKELVEKFCDESGLVVIKQVDMYPLPNGQFNDAFSYIKLGDDSK